MFQTICGFCLFESALYETGPLKIELIRGRTVNSILRKFYAVSEHESVRHLPICLKHAHGMVNFFNIDSHKSVKTPNLLSLINSHFNTNE